MQHALLLLLVHRRPSLALLRTAQKLGLQGLTARMSENCLEPTLSAPTIKAFS